MTAPRKEAYVRKHIATAATSRQASIAKGLFARQHERVPFAPKQTRAKVETPQEKINRLLKDPQVQAEIMRLLDEKRAMLKAQEEGVTILGPKPKPQKQRSPTSVFETIAYTAGAIAILVLTPLKIDFKALASRIDGALRGTGKPIAEVVVGMNEAKAQGNTIKDMLEAKRNGGHISLSVLMAKGGRSAEFGVDRQGRRVVLYIPDAPGSKLPNYLATAVYDNDKFLGIEGIIDLKEHLAKFNLTSLDSRAKIKEVFASGTTHGYIISHPDMNGGFITVVQAERSYTSRILAYVPAKQPQGDYYVQGQGAGICVGPVNNEIVFINPSGAKVFNIPGIKDVVLTSDFEAFAVTTSTLSYIRATEKNSGGGSVPLANTLAKMKVDHLENPIMISQDMGNGSTLVIVDAENSSYLASFLLQDGKVYEGQVLEKSVVFGALIR